MINAFDIKLNFRIDRHHDLFYLTCVRMYFKGRAKICWKILVFLLSIRAELKVSIQFALQSKAVSIHLFQGVQTLSLNWDSWIYSSTFKKNAFSCTSWKCRDKSSVLCHGFSDDAYGDLTFRKWEPALSAVYDALKTFLPKYTEIYAIVNLLGFRMSQFCISKSTF